MDAPQTGVQGSPASPGGRRKIPLPAAKIFFYPLLILTLLMAGWLFSPFAHDVLLAFVLAALLGPMYERLTRVLRGRNSIAAGTCVTVVVLAVAGPLTLLATSLFQEVQTLYLSINAKMTLEYIEKLLFGRSPFAITAKSLARKLGLRWTPEAVQSWATDVMGSWSSILYDQLNSLIANTLAMGFHFGITLLLLFYILLDGKQLKPYIMRLTPLPDDEDEQLYQQFKAMSRAIVYGNGIGSLIQGILGGIALDLAGIRSPVLWGTVMALFSSLPVVGVSVVSVPAALYLAFQGDYLTAILLYGFCSIMNLTVENVVKTKLIGSQIEIHSLLIFMSILGGIGMFGVLGLLYGPLLVAVMLTVLELYDEHYRGDAQADSGGEMRGISAGSGGPHASGEAVHPPV